MAHRRVEVLPADQPTPASERVVALDALRGFALAGVLFANLPLFAGHPYMTEAQLAALPTATADSAVGAAMRWLVEDKFMSLFAVLFGIGATMQLARAEARGTRGLRSYLRRLGWLLAIGSVHGWLFWSFDILRFYALWGLLLPWLDRLRSRALLAASLLFGLVVPVVWRGVVVAMSPAASPPAAEVPRSHLFEAFAGGDYLDVLAANWTFDWQLTTSATQGAYQATILGRMLLGLWLGRRLLTAGLPTRSRLRAVALVGLPLGLLGSAVYADLLEVPRTFWRAVPVEIGTLCLTLAWLALFLTAWQTPAGGRVLAHLAPVGRMSLTNYLLQTALGLWLFYGFLPGPGLMGEVGAAALVPIWAALFAVQVVGSRLWLRHFAFGPVEWLWRSLTYGTAQPWRPARPPEPPIVGAASATSSRG
jgi:uncharacterized protein